MRKLFIPNVTTGKIFTVFLSLTMIFLLKQGTVASQPNPPLSLQLKEAVTSQPSPPLSLQLKEAVTSQPNPPLSLQLKMEQVEQKINSWVAAGGNHDQIGPLGHKVDTYLKAGKFKEAAKVLDQILAIVESKSSQARSSQARVKIRVYDAKGRPVPKSQLLPKLVGEIVVGVYPLDIDYNPVPSKIVDVKDGVITLADPIPAPLLLHFFPRVKGFGQVKVYADNGGKGYVPPDSGAWVIDLPLEAVKSRIAKTQEAIKDKPGGVVFRKETLDHLSSAKKYLAAATEGKSIDAEKVYRALNEALWAGEMATFDAAKQTIAKRGYRDNFLIGCSANGFPVWGAREKDRFKALFNFATIAEFYLRGYEDKRGKPQPKGAENILAWLEKEKIKAKGHPLVYLVDYNIPKWLKGKKYKTMEEAMGTRIQREVKHFKGRIKVWDIINEAHIPNQYYTQTQFVELTRWAAKKAKDADPAVTRVVNVAWPTGDYVSALDVRPLVAKGMAQTPYQFLKALQEARVDYDVIGIQIYYPGLDMMELSRLLDRFAKLGKKIHITEIGVSSAPGIDRKSFFNKQDFSILLGEWHRPWDEDLQADWLEQFYTIAYSKLSVESISWWNFSDEFWPFGGLLRRDLTPKKSYWRLKKLLKSWSDLSK